MTVGHGDDGAPNERRKRRRVPLHWTVYLVSQDVSQPVYGRTGDLSRDGFYCVLQEALTPGARIDCFLLVPTHIGPDPGNSLSLCCHTQVLRVEKLGHDEGYGVAFRIEDYCVMHGSPLNGTLPSFS